MNHLSNHKKSDNLDFYSLIRAVDTNKLENTYLIWGEEDYLIEEAVKRIISRAIEPEAADFNLNIFYGNEVDGARVVETASAYAFLGEKRVVVVKDLQRMKPTEIDVINRYLTKPSPSTCLVLVATKLNFQFKATKDLKKRCTPVELKPLYDNQVPGWIKQYVTQKKMQISVEAMRLLQENAGNSLRGIVNELEKVILNLEGRLRIEENDIRQVVGLSRGYTVFNLSNLIGQKKIGPALVLVSRMIELGESPIGILAMLTRHFSILLKLNFARKKGMSLEQQASFVGTSQYFLKDYSPQVEKFTRAQIQQAFSFLLEADVALKSSGQKPQLILELLIYNLVRH